MNSFGTHFRVSIFGESHGPQLGVVLDGVPAGLPLCEEDFLEDIARRAPGAPGTTPRKESDLPHLLSGVYEGHTTGAPLTIVFDNANTRSGDYSQFAAQPRPGHADYTAQVKYGGFQDAAGGGHFSGRLTAPLCIAGGLCKQWLAERGIRVAARIAAIAGVEDNFEVNPLNPQLDLIGNDFPVFSPDAGARMREKIAEARSDCDSVGGIIECYITGVPAGLGEPMFGGVESRIAQIVYGVPAVKSVEFGVGCEAANLRGSQCNDAFTIDDGQICTMTNNAGGILGGITNGMPVIFRAAIKPTPSISRPQQSVCLSKGAVQELVVKGRHDPCIVPRAVPVIEAAAAIAMFDLILGNTQTDRRK